MCNSWHNSNWITFLRNNVAWGPPEGAWPWPPKGVSRTTNVGWWCKAGLTIPQILAPLLASHPFWNTALILISTTHLESSMTVFCRVVILSRWQKSVQTYRQTHEHLPKYSKLFLCFFLLQKVSPGWHFASMTNKRRDRMWKFTSRLSWMISKSYT